MNMSLKLISLLYYLQDTETPLSYSNEAESGVILNYAKDSSLSSVEILDASKRYPSVQLAASSIDELIDLKTASRLAGIAPVTLRTQAEKGKLINLLNPSSSIMPPIRIRMTKQR